MDAARADFYFDPVCPFAWMTSKWVRQVAAQRSFDIGWRFISLRLVNREIDYASHFPQGYERGHTAGLELLRVAARVRSSYGNEAVGRLYEIYGAEIFDRHPGRQRDVHADSHAFAAEVLERLGLPTDLAGAVADGSLDEAIQAETDQALSLTGRDVGTPIIHFEPPGGAAFFGPVISRLPDDERAVELWDHIVALAEFPGFAEIKRSLRERPQLVALGADPSTAGQLEDWHQGRRAD